MRQKLQVITPRSTRMKITRRKMMRKAMTVSTQLPAVCPCRATFARSAIAGRRRASLSLLPRVSALAVWNLYTRNVYTGNIFPQCSRSSIINPLMAFLKYFQHVKLSIGLVYFWIFTHWWIQHLVTLTFTLNVFISYLAHGEFKNAFFKIIAQPLYLFTCKLKMLVSFILYIKLFLSKCFLIKLDVVTYIMFFISGG